MQLDWDGLVAQTQDLVGGYLPNLLAAIAILVVGWVLALIAGALVRAALRRTRIDNKVLGWMSGDSTHIDIEATIGKIVTWIVLLFVIVATFQVLQLNAVTQPLNALLTEITEFAPRLLGAALLLALAWIVATVLRKVVSGALRAARLDDRLSETDAAEVPEEQAAEGAAPSAGEPVSLARTISEAVYWLVFLLFLPAILGTLAIEGLLAPVQSLTSDVLGFLPQLLAAVLIVAVGWFIARLVQRITSNLLAAAGIDSLADRIGLSETLGERRLSSILGLVVYILVLLPVLVSALNALALDAITRPASDMLAQVIATLPRLFGATLLLVIAWLVARVVAELVANLLRAAGFDRLPEALGIRGPQQTRLSSVVETLLVVAVMLFASVEAAQMLGFNALAGLLSGFIVFAGQVLLGLVILAVGLYLARLADDTISTSSTPNASLLGLTARVAILVLAVAMGLRQVGVAGDIINLAFGLLLGAMALAAALAFGLGARESAGELVREWLGRLRERG